MRQAEWQGVEELLEQALEVEPEARQAFLDGACCGEELRLEVKSLLAYGERVEQFLPVPVLEMLSLECPALERAAVPLEPELQLANGQVLGPYRITALLGRGGMGEVYQAAAPHLGGDVALKFLPSRAARDRQALERFQREARATSLLNHPGICALYDIAEHEDRPFMVLELLEGESLKQRLALGPLAPGELIEVAIQIAEALEAAHSNGIIHRDIKPANVFLTARGQVKVLDFGLVKLLSEPHGRVMTAIAKSGAGGDTISLTGAMMGTLAYMSPEQARGEKLDARSDLFSLGVTLYQMAAGRLPFHEATPPATMQALLSKPPVPPHDVNPLIAQALERVILRSLEKDPSHRYQRAAEMIGDLERLRPAAKPAQFAMPCPEHAGRESAAARPLDLCAQGRLLLTRRTPSSAFQALHCYERAVEIDRNCADAWAGVCECYLWMAAFGMDPVGGNFKAHSAARRAIDLEETGWAGHLAYGFYHYSMGWDWEIAERELRRAIELSPDCALAHERLVWILTARGRLDEALRIALRAVDLNPLSASARSGYANVFYIGRRYLDAEHAFRAVIGVDPENPDFYFIHLALGMIYLGEGRYQDAMRSFLLTARLTARTPPVLACYALACALAGDRDEAERVLAEIHGLARAAPVSPVVLALVHTGLGEADVAFDYLRQACQSHCPLFHWASYPLFDFLRGDGRLEALLRSVGLPAAVEDFRFQKLYQPPRSV